MKKKIVFQWGTEKQIKVSSAGHRDSLFYESYRQALAGITEIVRASMRYTQKRDPLAEDDGNGSRRGLVASKSEYDPENDKIYYNYPNNMIVFTGERGAGKSSALLTFTDSLRNKNSGLFSNDFLEDMVCCELPGAMEKQVGDMLRQTSFFPIPPIDPTTLNEKHQILEVILSRIYAMAKSAWATIEENTLYRAPEKRQEHLNQKNELLKQFSTCFRHINILRGKKDEDSDPDGLEILDTIGDTVYLKRELAELICGVLKFCCPGEQFPFLVIQVDDSDMNINHAYMILEDIRKYLVVPRVIIIMAADLNQLNKLVEQSFGDERCGVEGFREQAHSLAGQYVTKLFPSTRQIWLPSLSVYLKEKSENTEIVSLVLGEKKLPDKNKNYQDSQDQLFRLIYSKTGMIFLRTKERLHYIIPDNMRLLSHLLALLTQMAEVADPDKEQYGLFLEEGASGGELKAHIKTLHNRLNNVQRFRDFFLSVWVSNNLSPKDASVIKQLDNTNIDIKVAYIYAILTDGKDSHEDVSFAELLTLLDEKDHRSSAAASKKFHFAIWQYFSFLGHCMALQELITYYERLDEAGIAKSNIDGCTFISLQPVFGSTAFTLPGTKTSSGETILAKWERSDESIGAEINYQWKADYKAILNKYKYAPEVAAFAYLVSMLMDYNRPRVGNPKIANLNYCMMNCLYVRKGSPVTNYSQKEFKGAMLSTRRLPLTDWEVFQSSSLMALLNWDVLRRIRYRLMEMTEDESKDSGRDANGKDREPAQSGLSSDLSSWRTTIRQYYFALVDGFSPKPENQKPEGVYKYPIQCLKTMDFTGWLTPLLYIIPPQSRRQKSRSLIDAAEYGDTVINEFFENTTTQKRAGTTTKPKDGSNSQGAPD